MTPTAPSSREAEQKPVAGLILAAGESSRMVPLGTHKALLGYHGRTFLENIVAAFRNAGVDRIAAVLGHRADEIQHELAGRLEGVQLVVNRDYLRGQSSSLQAGLQVLSAADREQIPEAVVLCLVDHPAVTAKTIRAVIASFRRSGAPVVIPLYRNQRGHPVLFSRALFRELKDLGPDAGANTIVRKYRDATRYVAVNDPGVLVDIDDPESYYRLIR